MSELALPGPQTAAALQPLEAARALIAQAVANEDVVALNELRAQASAYELYHRRSGAREVANDAGEIKVRAERGLGQIDLAENPRGRPQKDSGSRTFSLAVHAETRALWRRLAELRDEELDARFERVRKDENSAISTSGLLETSTARNIVASDENEWHTPARYIEPARTVLGGAIDFDPASSAEANETVKAARFCTATDNGLLAKWAGRVWLNPPYGGLAGTFVNRLVDEFYGGEVTAAIALVNAHCTDTEWFKPLFNQLLCFTDHRIDFDSAGREKRTTSTHGSVFAYFGTDHAAFIREFGAFGVIVTHV